MRCVPAHRAGFPGAVAVSVLKFSIAGFSFLLFERERERASVSAHTSTCGQGGAEREVGRETGSTPSEEPDLGRGLTTLRS